MLAAKSGRKLGQALIYSYKTNITEKNMEKEDKKSYMAATIRKKFWLCPKGQKVLQIQI